MEHNICHYHVGDRLIDPISDITRTISSIGPGDAVEYYQSRDANYYTVQYGLINQWVETGHLLLYKALPPYMTLPLGA